jgi:translocator protein
MPGVEKNIDGRKCLVLSVKRKLFFSIAAGVILCLGVGFLAGQATQMSVKTWYTTLEKPFFTPPDTLFAPVWTLLYLLMGIAVGRIGYFSTRRQKGKTALYLFGFQLLVNGLWSLVFFGLRTPLWGMVVILILLFLIVKTIQQFKAIDLLATRLLYPYLLWVFYASLLNGGIVLLNFS